MNTETPTITACNYQSASSSPQMLWEGEGLCAAPQLFIQPTPLPLHEFLQQQQQPSTEQEKIMATPTRRIVQVFIADPNENVPLEQSVLYRGDQKLTDLTDTELYFEVPMADLLKSHNEKRVKFTDREASKRAGKDIMLDPVKIRDLKMVVVTVAQF